MGIGDLMTLSDLKENQTATITKIDDTCSISRRLFDLGFIAGQDIACINVGAFGSPIAYNLRGFKVALRKKDADKVWVVL
ncbi:MAG: ferrous iron transport protein A [Eubacterium sp.]|nr:ferrous iron transport protein A [Eubacterium sp.]